MNIERVRGFSALLRRINLRRASKHLSTFVGSNFELAGDLNPEPRTVNPPKAGKPQDPHSHRSLKIKLDFSSRLFWIAHIFKKAIIMVSARVIAS